MLGFLKSISRSAGIFRQARARRRLAQFIGVDEDPKFVWKVAEQRRRGTSIGKKCRLIGSVDAINPQLVSIGDYCVIGGASILLAHGPTAGDSTPVVVGNYVYLGYRVTVLPGVTIGDYAIIGAGAVVTKNVPPGSVAAGNPARVLRAVSEDEKRTIREHMHNGLLFGKVAP